MRYKFHLPEKGRIHIEHHPIKDDVNGIDTQNTTEWLQKRITNKSCYIECGAHVGFVAVNVVKKATPKLAILIEPNSYAFDLLKRNLEGNGCENYIVKKVIAWDGPMEKKEFYEAGYAAHSSVVNKEGRVKTYREAVSVDSLVEEYKIEDPIWLKIDAELAEPLIWEGMQKSLHLIKGFVMEFMPTAIWESFKIDPAKFILKIRDKGFKISNYQGKEYDNDELTAPEVSKLDLYITNENEVMGGSR